MMGYASRTGTKKNLAGLRQRGWGLMISATGVHRDEGFDDICIDNGAWTAHQKKVPWRAIPFLRVLALFGPRAKFAVATDIVGGGLQSLAMSLAWLPLVLAACPRALIPVQEGIAPDDVRQYLGERIGIFVGGADGAWKEATTPMWARLAREHGAYIHVGRVNTKRRIAICAEAGVDSFDGTSATRYSKMLPRLERARVQPNLPWWREA